MINKLLNKKKPLWKTVINAESKNSNWEILKYKDKMILHYVPEDDYGVNDVRILLPIEHFEDLIEFMKELNKNVKISKNDIKKDFRKS